MKRIAIIPPGNLPIPALGGGAVEGLTTYIIEENEKAKACYFTVFNRYNENNQLKQMRMAFTDVCVDKHNPFDQIHDKVCLALRKLSGYSIPYSSAYLNRTIQRINKQRFDVILVEGNPNYVWKLAEKTNVPTVLHVHTDHVLDSSLHSYQQVICHSKKIICVSEYIKKQLSKLPQMPKDKLKVCLNCTDQKKFNDQVRCSYRADMRRKYGYSDDDVVFAFAGRVEMMKGVGDLVEAFKRCNVVNKKLLIIGGSNFSDSTETEFIQQLKNEAKLSGGTIVLTGYVDKEELPRYLSMADVFVSPSKYDEAAPLANIEAMSFGLPIIVSDRGGVKEYANDGAIVLNCDEQLPNRLCQSMELLGADKALRQRMGLAAYQQSTNWNVKRYYQDMIDVLTENDQQ